MNTDLQRWLYQHLTNTEYFICDLQQALVLSGSHDIGLERCLQASREALESARDRCLVPDQQRLEIGVQ